MIIKIIEIKCKHSALTLNLIHSPTRLFSMTTLPTEALHILATANNLSSYSVIELYCMFASSQCRKTVEDYFHQLATQ